MYQGVHVAAPAQGDAARRMALHLDGLEQLAGLVRPQAAVHEALSVGPDIGVGEDVAQIAGDLLVVGVPQYVLHILLPPGAQNEIHLNHLLYYCIIYVCRARAEPLPQTVNKERAKEDRPKAPLVKGGCPPQGAGGFRLQETCRA